MMVRGGVRSPSAIQASSAENNGALATIKSVLATLVVTTDTTNPMEETANIKATNTCGPVRRARIVFPTFLR